MALPTFKTERQESIPADEARTADIFARLGYRIPDAVGDIIDNSVDADAAHVHIRFIRSDRGIHSVVIADDGHGMSNDELREAMRFGSRSSKSSRQLGKYGVGLKSASLSQADKVTVLSRRGKKFVGRRWTLPNVRKGWTCDVLREEDVKKAFAVPFGEFKISRAGTIVIWEELEHLQALPNHIDKVLDRTKKELAAELGIRFHRFLESGQLAISMDEQVALQQPPQIPAYVTPLDPFGYDESPNRDFPLTLKFKVADSVVTAECHIWPPKSRAPNYRLGGGKVALRQGFYFYRNDRVIQAGGWNQLRADDGEPHLSLARVKVDLPSELDSLFKLDVTKSRLDPAPAFMQALQAAQSHGLNFDKFIEQAGKAYRKQKSLEGARFPVVPGSGLPKAAQDAITSILKEDGTGRPTRVALKWSRLDSDEVVRVQAGEPAILLNDRFRKELVEGGSRDAPVLKVALMFLLQNEIGKAFSTKVSSEWIQRVNHALIAALKK